MCIDVPVLFLTASTRFPDVMRGTSLTEVRVEVYKNEPALHLHADDDPDASLDQDAVQCEVRKPVATLLRANTI